MQEWRRTSWDPPGWLSMARQIEARRPSCHRYKAVSRHLGLFPADLIGIELDRDVLRALRRFLVTSHPGAFGRPARGFRQDGPHTGWTMVINNQLARLDVERGRNWPDHERMIA